MSKKGNVNNTWSVLKEHEQQIVVFLLYSENSQNKKVRKLCTDTGCPFYLEVAPNV